MKLSFFSKNFIFSCLSVLLIGLSLTVACYFIQGKVIKQTIADQARGHVAISSLLLDKNDLKQTLTNHDFNSPLHQKITSQLDLFTKLNPDIAQAYLFGTDLRNGNETVNLAMPRHVLDFGVKLGEVFPQPPLIVAAIQEMLETKKTTTSEVYEDEFGTWISVLEPIADENGNIYAYFGVDIDASVVKKGQNELLIWSSIVLGGLLLFIFVSQFFVLKKMLKPIGKIHQVIQTVSQGNLNVELDIKSQDEFGDLSRNFQNMVEQIRTMIKTSQDSVDRTTESVNQLSTSVEQNSQSLDQITTAIREVASGAERQTIAISETNMSMNEMVIGIQRISESSSIVAEISTDMTQQANRGNDAMQQMMTQMDDIRTSVYHTASVVHLLDSRSQEIAQIVEVISAIASQTNLLALNAAIEAARAGETGRGFAVVADEVRKLAEQSNQSAQQISQLITEIQSETHRAVSSMNHGTKEVDRGLEIASEAGGLFKSMIDVTHKVDSQIQEVSATAEEMSAGSQQILATVSSLHHIAQESSSAATQVVLEIENQMSAMDTVQESVANLNGNANVLKTSIGKFIV